MTRARLDLEATAQSDVLEIGLQSFQHVRGLAEHIESRGDFHRFKLYSVDAHLAQRFLNDHECIPFGRVRWSPDEPTRLSTCGEPQKSEIYPPFHTVKLSVKRTSGQGLPTLQDTVEWFRLETVHEPGVSPRLPVQSLTVKRSEHDSMGSMLAAFQAAYDAMNPDVVLTEGGDQRWFPWLVEQGTLHGQAMVLGGHQHRFSKPPTSERSTRTVKPAIGTGHISRRPPSHRPQEQFHRERGGPLRSV